MPDAQPQRHALLIVATTFDESRIPSVPGDIKRMAAVLGDPEFGGLRGLYLG